MHKGCLICREFWFTLRFQYNGKRYTNVEQGKVQTMTMYMKTVVLNGKDFKTIEELHTTLQQILELPAEYGCNLDALWDSLTGQIELPMQIEWLNYEQSREYLGDYAEQVLGLMEEVQGEGNGFRVWVQQGAVAF